MKLAKIEKWYFSVFDKIKEKFPGLKGVPLTILWLIPLVIVSYVSMVWFLVAVSLGKI